MNADKIERFQAFVDADPANPLHNFALAQALLSSGDMERAERAFARCLEIDPRWMVASIRHGRCLIALERWDAARAALELGAELATAQGHDEPFGEIRELMDQLPG